VRLEEISGHLGLRTLTPELSAEMAKEVSSGHASDLLSDVLANAPQGGILITIQVHMNVIAVAAHAGLAGVILTTGRAPEEAVREKAVEEKIPLFISEEATFDVVGRLYALGLRERNA
jgi:hypothetical protein